MAIMRTPIRIADLVRGNYNWTPRQREVLDLLARRYTNGQIAEILGISLDGAKWHVMEVMTKLSVDSREEAAEYWREYNGLGRRFTRVFQGIAAVGGLKWALGGAGAIAGIAVVAGAAYLAIGSDAGVDSEAGSPDLPIPTVQVGGPAAPIGEAPGETGFRGFAPDFDADLGNDGLDALADRLRATTYSCGADGRVEFSDMTCTPGAQVEAFPGGIWKSEGSMSTVDEMATQLRQLDAGLRPAASDRFGDGALRLHALAVSPNRTAAVLTGITNRPAFMPGDGPIRFALAVDFTHDGTAWAATRIITAYVLAEDFLLPTGEGETALPGWERFQ